MFNKVPIFYLNDPEPKYDLLVRFDNLDNIYKRHCRIGRVTLK
jgi:hypothetical protein